MDGNGDEEWKKQMKHGRVSFRPGFWGLKLRGGARRLRGVLRWGQVPRTPGGKKMKIRYGHAWEDFFLGHLN